MAKPESETSKSPTTDVFFNVFFSVTGSYLATLVPLLSVFIGSYNNISINGINMIPNRQSGMNQANKGREGLLQGSSEGRPTTQTALHSALCLSNNIMIVSYTHEHRCWLLAGCFISVSDG